uniref:Uncharacterized protein n=1 Tax=viral metagenome TaxID=1070528 RepID=A0A6C0E1X8_9ZZZZ
MLAYLICVSCFISIFAYQPLCDSCKHFIPNKNLNPDLGLCKMFQETSYNNGYIRLYNFATHCRNDENLCGKSGFLYEGPPSDNPEIIYQLNELSNKCCGEVNEKNELEELEREFFEIFQKMKKYNTARKYRSS